MKLLIFILFLIFITPVYALNLNKKWNDENQTMEIYNNANLVATVELISKTPDIVTFEEVLKLTSYANYTFESLKDFRVNQNKIAGNYTISNYDWFILENGEWKPFNPIGKSIKANEYYIVKIIYHKKAETSDVLIQTLPMFMGFEEKNLTWWNVSWSNVVHNPIPNGQRPFQISLNISNASGTNTAYNVYCDSNCNSNFSDIRFTLDNTTLIPHWIENLTTGKLWINLTDNGTVNLYYGNTLATQTSNITTTMIFGDDFDGDLSKWNYNNAAINNGSVVISSGTANYINSKQSYNYPVIFEMYGKIPGYSSTYGLTESTTYITLDNDVNGIFFTTLGDSNLYNYWQNNVYGDSKNIRPVNTHFNSFKIVWTGAYATTRHWVNETIVPTMPSTYFPSSASSFHLVAGPRSGTHSQPEITLNYTYLRRYLGDEPIWNTWTTSVDITPTINLEYIFSIII